MKALEKSNICDFMYVLVQYNSYNGITMQII